MRAKKADIRLGIISVALGGACGAVAAAVYVLMIDLEILVWHTVEIPRWAILPLTTIGGIITGWTIMKGADLDVDEEIAQAQNPMPNRGRQAMWTAVGAVAAVSFGGVIGPEGGIVALTLQLSTMVALRLGRTAAEQRTMAEAGVAGGMAGFYGSPVAGPVQAEGKDQVPKATLLLAGVAGVLFFMWTANFLREGALGMMYLPRFNISPRPMDAVIAIAPALAGALAGALFIWAVPQLKRIFGAYMPGHFWAPVAGGIILGVVCTFAPILLFSGHSHIGNMLQLGQEYGPALLIVMGVMKVLLCAVCISSHWKGGAIFPLSFGGAALGAATLFIFQGLDPTIGVAAGMTGAATVGLKKPLLAGAVMIFVLGDGVLLPICVGVLAGWMLLNVLPEKLLAQNTTAH